MNTRALSLGRRAGVENRQPRVRGGVTHAVCLLLLSGCSGSVVVPEAFPEPLVERLPLRVAVHYPADLAAYVYKEDAAADRDWTVQLGAANVRMFDSVFAGLFAETRRVSDIASALQEMPDLDVIVSPAVDAFEFSLPSQSATDQYAVWIRYNLDVYGRDGQRILRWPVAAYGQSGTGGLSDEASMERATVLALRDAAATIAVNFSQQPKIREVLGKEEAPDEP
jgi:hypothetical protein